MLKTLLSILVLPPANLAVVALIALAVARHRIGRAIALASVGLLVLLGTPLVANLLLWQLEVGLPEALPGAEVPQAIVILSAETRLGAAGSGGTLAVTTDLGPLTLERLRAGALLARRTTLPVLTTGGRLSNDVGENGFTQPPVAAIMTRALETEWNLPVRWTEDRAADTWENAAFSAPMLKAAGISKIYLVTHAWHERRALVAFRAAGITAIAAPVRWDIRPHGGFADLVPTAESWVRCYYAFHEWVGLAWYSWRAG